MVLAEQFYSSGTFWAASGTLAVIVVGIISIYVIWLQGNPIRSLRYGMLTAPLLQGAAEDMPGTLQVTYNGAVVADPHVLEVTLVSRGRRDIVAEDFDQRPLQFTVGAKILAILGTACTPAITNFQTVDFDETNLKVGPALIGRRQTISFTLLADGRDPELSSPATILRDVKFEKLSVDPARHHLTSKMLAAASATAVAALTAALILVLVTLHNPAPTDQPTPPGRTHASSAPGKLKAAVAELNSASTKTQVSGIMALQHIMRASPASQPAALRALSVFLRRWSPVVNNDPSITGEIQEALNALKSRNAADDGGAIINLARTNLTNANLGGIDLTNANLTSADLTNADIEGANFTGADLANAYLGDAALSDTNFADADLIGASFYQTSMCSGSTAVHQGEGYNCSK